MKHLIYYASAALCALSLWSCNSDTGDVSAAAAGDAAGGTPLVVRLATDTGTRVMTPMGSFETTFSQNDKVGLFIVKHGTDITTLNAQTEKGRKKDVWLYNEPFTVDDPASGHMLYSGTLTLDERMWPNTSDQYDVYAYFPYRADADLSAGFDIAVDVDQNKSDADYNTQMDFLCYAAVVKGGADLALNFQHMLSLLETRVDDTNLTGAGLAAGTAHTVTVEALTSANVKFATAGGTNFGTVACAASDTNQKQDIVMQQRTEGTTTYHRALIPAQTLPAGTKFVLHTQAAQDIEFCSLTDAWVIPSQMYAYYDYTGGAQNNPMFPRIFKAGDKTDIAPLIKGDGHSE